MLESPLISECRLSKCEAQLNIFANCFIIIRFVGHQSSIIEQHFVMDFNMVTLYNAQHPHPPPPSPTLT